LLKKVIETGQKAHFEFRERAGGPESLNAWRSVPGSVGLAGELGVRA
jgi:hypothetical protein